MPRGVQSGQRQRENRRHCYCPLCPDSTKKISSTLWKRHQDAWRARTLAQDAQSSVPADPIDIHENTFFESLSEIEGNSARSDGVSSNLESNSKDGKIDDDADESTSGYDSDNDESNDHLFSGNVSLNNLPTVDSWDIADKELKEAITWYIWKIEHAVSNTAFENRPMSTSSPNLSLYRLKRALQRLSGLSFTKSVCCINVCAAFEDALVRVCLHCEQDLYEMVELASGTITRAQKHWFYFDPVPRLVLD